MNTIGWAYALPGAAKSSLRGVRLHLDGSSTGCRTRRETILHTPSGGKPSVELPPSPEFDGRGSTPAAPPAFGGRAGGEPLHEVDGLSVSPGARGRGNQHFSDCRIFQQFAGQLLSGSRPGCQEPDRPEIIEPEQSCEAESGREGLK